MFTKNSTKKVIIILMYISTAMVCAGIVEAKTKQWGYFTTFCGERELQRYILLEIDTGQYQFKVIYILVDF